jgi:hypothetical protein
METIFTLSDIDDDSKINLDELYERKQQSDLNTLKIYNRILQRIHSRIRHVSKLLKEQHCWYVIPEIIIGVPKYDNVSCITYIIDKLRENGFVVKYTHPNLVFISWQSWTPSYVREEIRKKTGIQIDGWGNKKNTDSDPLLTLGNKAKNINVTKSNTYRDTSTYKPTGSLIYNQELLKSIEDKTI